MSEQVKKLQSSKIICRTCKGDHWTTKCPYKDTLRPLEGLLDGTTGSSATGTKPSSAEMDTNKLSANTLGGSKYCPPSLRGKPAGSSDATGGSSFNSRRADDDTTLRVTNLSEDAQEADLSALFKRFGPISRIFLASDRETGLCKGFAFITFISRESAAKAIEVMNGYGFDNLILTVEWSK